MTLLDRVFSNRSAPRAAHRLQDMWHRMGEPQQQGTNVGTSERAVAVAAGSILTLLGASRRSIPGLVIAAVGGDMLYRGLTGHSPAYAALGLNTAKRHGGRISPEEELATRGVEVRQAFLINRPAEQLYQFWRDFTNLPKFMSQLESVRVTDGDGKRTHWVAKAPRLAGSTAEWDAELTADEPNKRIAWRSLPGSEIDTAGEITFEKALGDRGTEVHVTMRYNPPGGRLGHALVSLLGSNPKRMIREDLRNFKRLMELGEIPTIVGQTRGTCTGQGTREQEPNWKPFFK